jgi:purine catabolism regulator
VAITVAQALKIGGLREGCVLAGARHLDNAIEHVNIIEALLASDWETGWEAQNHLLLTTFNTAKDDVDKQKRIIEVFHGNGCAGLVFQQGVIDYLSPAAIEHAEGLGLPLIEVPESVTYPAIITPLVGAILREKTFLLQRAQEIHDRLSRLILDGGGLQAIARVLNELICSPIAITDQWGDVLAVEDFDGQSEVIPVPEPHGSAASERESTEPVWDEERRTWILPLRSGQRGGAEGFILVRDVDKKIDRFDWIAVEQAATIAVLDLVKQKAVLEAERRLKRDFVEDLLGGGYHSVEAMLARARSLGWDLRHRRVVALVDLNRFEQYYLSHIELGEQHFQRVKDRLLRAVSRAVSRENPAAILADRSDSIVLLPHFDDESPPSMARSEMQRLAEAICDEARGQPNGPSISIAVGGFYESVAGLCHSYREAESALRVGLRMEGLGSILWYDEVALYTMLDRIGSEPETRRWLHRTLGPLTVYDRENDTEMVKTLEAYFDANQVIKVAADDLFIHPKTLKYRLRRIEEILGSDPFSGDQQLRFYLATKMAKLLPDAPHLDWSSESR